MRTENLTLREIILKQFELCKTVAGDIIRHNAGETDEDMLYYAKHYAQIESFITGETDCAWFRINYGDIYIYLDVNEKIFDKEDRIKFKKIRYELNGCDGAGGEAIEAESVADFLVQLENLSDEELLAQHFYPDSDEDKVPEYMDYETWRNMPFQFSF